MTKLLLTTALFVTILMGTIGCHSTTSNRAPYCAPPAPACAPPCAPACPPGTVPAY